MVAIRCKKTPNAAIARVRACTHKHTLFHSGYLNTIVVDVYWCVLHAYMVVHV